MSKLEAMPDADLLIRWRGGEQRAGVLLVERHYDAIARFFMHKLGTEGEDLTQATFLALLEGIERFRGDASVRTLLFTIARNKLLTHLDKRRRDQGRFDPRETSLAALAPSATSALAAQERHKLLLAALRRLPIDTQLMLELHYWEEMPIKDIALVVATPINTVKTRMRRGRQRLDDEMRSLAESNEQLVTTRRGLERWAAQLHAELDGEPERR